MGSHWPQLLFISIIPCRRALFLIIEFTSYVNGKIITYHKYRITQFLFVTRHLSSALLQHLVQKYVKIYFLCAHTLPLLLCAIDIFVLTQLRITYLSLWLNTEPSRMVIVGNDICTMYISSMNVRCVWALLRFRFDFWRDAIWWPSAE